MKQIKVADEITEDAQLATAVEWATRVLEDELGPSAGLVSAEWTLSADGAGRELVRLEISDFTGAAPDLFERSELEDERHLRARLHRLGRSLARSIPQAGGETETLGRRA